MMIPFVGRGRELRRIAAHLDDGRNIVLSGPFGSGRTTLVRHLAASRPDVQFLFLDSTATKRAILATLARAAALGGPCPPSRVVLVLDDVVRVTWQRQRLLRDLARRHDVRFVIIVERILPPDDLMRLRAALQAARLVTLGPVSRAAAEQYFTIAAARLKLNWSSVEIRSIAGTTHGSPLVMRLTLEAARSTWRAPAAPP